MIDSGDEDPPVQAASNAEQRRAKQAGAHTRADATTALLARLTQVNQTGV